MQFNGNEPQLLIRLLDQTEILLKHSKNLVTCNIKKKKTVSYEIEAQIRYKSYCLEFSLFPSYIWIFFSI